MPTVPPPKARFEEATDLTSRLKAAGSMQELSACLESFRSELDAVHDAVICHSIAGLWKRRVFDEAGKVAALKLVEATASRWLSRPPSEKGREGRKAANILYSFGVLKGVRRGLVREIAREATRLAESLSAQGAANCLWALATLGEEDECVTLPMLVAVATHAALFKPQEVSNVLWAIGRLEIVDVAAITAIASSAARLAPDFNTFDASTSLAALATIKAVGGVDVGEDVVRAVADAAVRCASVLDAQQIGSILRALATLRCCPDAASMEALAGAAISLIPHSGVGDAVSCLSAVAMLDAGVAPATTAALAGSVTRCIGPTVTSQQAIRSLWSLTTLGLGDKETITALAALIRGGIKQLVSPGTTTVSELKQLLQSHAFLSKCLPPARAITILDTASFTLAQGALTAKLAAAPLPSASPSHRQEAVYEALMRLSYDAKLDVPVLGDIITIDVLVTLPGQRGSVAIFVDEEFSFRLEAPLTGEGPSAPSAGTSSHQGAPAQSWAQRPTKGAVLRNRLLRHAAGLKFVVVPFFVWDALTAAGGIVREKYLHRMILDAAAAR